jgi:perosamine synthetase
MHTEIKSPLWGENLRNMLRSPKANPFPGIIGTFMGRDALSLAVSSLDLGAGDTVLLPAYLCQEVLKPFLGKTRVEFYDVRTDLAADPEEIKLKLSQGKVKLMVIINYFGFLQPYRKEIKEMCADRGIILLEDCAHSLLTEGSGETGDISIYSFRKTLPVPDGGGLKMNIEGKAGAPDFYPKVYSNILSVLIILKSLFKIRADIFSRAGLTSRTKNLVPSNPQAQKNSRILPLSSFAYNGMGNMSFPEIIAKRRGDYQSWQELAERTNLFTPFFSELPSGVCPLDYPVKIKNRDSLRSRLQKEGIYLKIYWNLPEAVGNEFVNSHKLAMQSIAFPVYPELGWREREGIQRLLTS